MIGVCPCCKRPLDMGDTLFSLDTNSVSRWGRSVDLSPKRAELFALLWAVHPGIVRTSQLIGGLWGVREPEQPVNALRVHVSNLRRMVDRLGIEIKDEYGRGYRLILHPRPIRLGWRAGVVVSSFEVAA